MFVYHSKKKNGFDMI